MDKMIEFEEYVDEHQHVFSTDQHHTVISLGLAGETGEVLELLKKEIRDGKDIRSDLILELGDVLHYLTCIAHWYGWNLEDVMEANISKLKKRYPDDEPTPCPIDWPDNQSREMGPPFPQFGPTGKYVGKGPLDSVRGSDSEPPKDSAGHGVQWVPEGASGRQAHAERQGDKDEQDDTCGDECDTELICPGEGGDAILSPIPTVR